VRCRRDCAHLAQSGTSYGYKNYHDVNLRVLPILIFDFLPYTDHSTVIRLSNSVANGCWSEKVLLCPDGGATRKLYSIGLNEKFSLGPSRSFLAVGADLEKSINMDYIRLVLKRITGSGFILSLGRHFAWKIKTILSTSRVKNLKFNIFMKRRPLRYLLKQ